MICLSCIIFALNSVTKLPFIGFHCGKKVEIMVFMLSIGELTT